MPSNNSNNLLNFLQVVSLVLAIAVSIKTLSSE